MPEMQIDEVAVFPKYIIDTIVIVILFLGSTIFALHLASLFPVSIYDQNDIWFGSDSYRVLQDMTNYSIDHYRTSVHPIFPLIFLPPTKTLMVLGLPQLTAVKIVTSLAAGTSVVFIYLTLRSIGISYVDSVLVNLVFLSSAAFMFWGGLAETTNFAALTISLAMLVAVRQSTLPMWIFASAATLAVSTPNWALGLLTSFFGNTWRRFVVINACALLAVVTLAILQQNVFPLSRLFFVPSSLIHETRYIRVGPSLDLDAINRRAGRLVNFWLFSGAVPAAELSRELWKVKTIVANDQATFADVDRLGKVALIAWSMMLAIGCLGVAELKNLQSIAFAIIGYLFFETMLCVLYGDVPFLYSLNYVPAMMLLCGFGLLSSAAFISRAAAIVFILSGAISNYVTLQKSIEVLSRVLAH